MSDEPGPRPGMRTAAAMIARAGRGMRVCKAVLLLLMLTLAAPVAAEPRVALVVGNAGYHGSLRRLANPVNDATVISSALRAAGFDVELVADADEAAMHRALDRFRDRIAAAGAGTTALFYYAGHGMQSGETNYLAPVDTMVLERDGVTADTALARMEEGGAAAKIVILDSCRDAPLLGAIGAGALGFRPMIAMERGREVFIAYSTAVGQTAADGDDGNSPFAAALARLMIVPGRPIEITFREVRAYVVHATGGRQTPWDSSSITTAFAFAGEGIRIPAEARSLIDRLTVNPPPSPVPAGAVQVGDFEAVPTATAPDFIAAARPYLRKGPVPLGIRDVAPAGSEIVFLNNRGRHLSHGLYAAPTLSQNFLTQINTGNGAASFTLVLPRPMRRVHFMTPRLFPETASGVTSPAWTATALGAGGNVLQTHARPVGREMTADIPSHMVSLEARGSDGITAIRFDSDPRLNGIPFAATSALLIEGVWIEPM
jgi:Caspase domain